MTGAQYGLAQLTTDFHYMYPSSHVMGLGCIPMPHVGMTAFSRDLSYHKVTFICWKVAYMTIISF